MPRNTVKVSGVPHNQYAIFRNPTALPRNPLANRYHLLDHHDTMVAWPNEQHTQAEKKSFPTSSYHNIMNNSWTVENSRQPTMRALEALLPQIFPDASFSDFPTSAGSLTRRLQSLPTRKKERKLKRLENANGLLDAACKLTERQSFLFSW